MQSLPPRRSAPRPAASDCRFALAPAASAGSGFVGRPRESSQAENYTCVKTFRLTTDLLGFSENRRFPPFFEGPLANRAEILGFCKSFLLERRRHEKARRWGRAP